MPLLGRAGLDVEHEDWRAIVQETSASDRTAPPDNENRRLANLLFPSCSNPQCRTGRLHLWRSHVKPVFEGGWACSPQCMRDLIGAAVRRDMGGRDVEECYPPLPHRHRVPLGLVMVAQGWITPLQLRSALESQKTANAGRLGEWLVREHGVDEHLVTRALSLQWSCPVFSVEHYRPEVVTAVVPRLLVDAFGILPIRVAAQRILYIGFEEQIDSCVTLALERMLGLRVESGLVGSAQFRSAHEGLLASVFPRSRLLEFPNAETMVAGLSRIVEKERHAEARLVRLYDWFWLRLWRDATTTGVPLRGAVEDILCTVKRPN